MDADTGQIIAAELTSKDVDDGSQVDPLLEQIAGAVASFTGDGAYDRDDVYREVCQRQPNPATPSVHPVPSAQALEAHEVTAPANNGSERGSSSAPPADKVVASPTPSAPSEQEPAASASTAIETALIPPSRITHGNKRMWVRRRRHEVTVRHWGALWRPDASAGPNPGGGFYDGPNINVGRINPK